MALFPRTIGVTNKLMEDIESFLFKTTIVVQIIFFAYYGYSICTNLDNLTLLVVFSLLLLLSTISFTYYLKNYHKKSVTKVKKVKKSFRIFKYLINGSMIIINLLEIIKYGGTDVAYLLIGFSTLSLLIQIIVEFLRVFTSYYLDLYKIALEKDTEKFQKIADLTDIKGNLVTILDTPFEAIAKKLDGKKKEASEKEKLVESLGNQAAENANMKKRLRRKGKVDKQLSEIKEHYSTIKTKVFKKEIKSNDESQIINKGRNNK